MQLLDTNSTLHSDFPHDPKGFYEEQEAKVFALLHCTKQSLFRDIAAQDQQQKDNLSESKEEDGIVGTDCKGLNIEEDGGSRGVVDEVVREVFPSTSATALSDEVDHTGDSFGVRDKHKNKNLDEVTDVLASSIFSKGHHLISGHNKSGSGTERGDSNSNSSSNSKNNGSGSDIEGDNHRLDPVKLSDKLFTNGSVSNAWGGDDLVEFLGPATSESTAHSQSSTGTIAQMTSSQISNHDLWSSVSSTTVTLNELDRGIIDQPYRGTINGIIGKGRAHINPRLFQPECSLQSRQSIQPKPKKRGQSDFDDAVVQSPSSLHYQTDRKHAPLKVSAIKISRTVASSDIDNCAVSLRSLPQLPPGLHRSPAGSGVMLNKSDSIYGRGSISRSPTSLRKRLRTDGPMAGSDGDSSSYGRRVGISKLSQNTSSYHSQNYQCTTLPHKDHETGFDRSSESDVQEVSADQNLFGVMGIMNSSQSSDANITQGRELTRTQAESQEPLITHNRMSTAAATSDIFLSSLGEAFDCEDW